MASSINASTSAGVVTTADTTGNLSLQSNGTTIAALTSTGLAVTGAGTFSTTLGVTGTSTLATINASDFITETRSTPRVILTHSASATDANSSINLTSSQGTVRWQIGCNQSTGTGLEINEGAAVNNRLYIAPGGAVTIPGTLGVTGAITGTTAALTSTVEAGLTISRSTDATCAIYLNRSGGANSWAMYRYGSSASDKFAIGRPGASEDFIITTAGAVTIPGTLAFGSGTTGSVGSWTSSTGSSKTGFFYADATYAAISTGSALTGQGMVLTATSASFMVANNGVFTATAGSGSTSGIQLNAYTTNGTVTTTGGTGVLSSASDATLKTHDGFVENPLNMLAGLKARYYFWNHELGKEEPAQRQLGFFAQDVNEHLGDEAANPPKGDAKWGYYDRSVLAVAVEAINALAADFQAYKQSHP